MNIEKVHIIYRCIFSYKIKINNFLPEMLHVVLVAENSKF